MKKTMNILLVLALALTASTAFARSTLGGRVLSESGKPLQGAIVRSGAATASTDAQGRFSLQSEEEGLHLLHYSAGDHFSMIHGYSDLELEWLSAKTARDTAIVPDVTLVERNDSRIMMVFGGDAMMGRRYSKPPAGEPVLIREGHEQGDTVALLAHIRPYLEIADFASVNLETQVMRAEPEQNAPKSYVFYTPPEALLALKASGVDYVTLGNNHTYDYLSAGLESTLEALEASELGWSGAGLTEAQALEPYRVEIGENPMSFIGFLGWAGNFSPNQVAMGAEKGGAAFGTPENIRNTVRREKEQGRLPVVQYHGSREYTDEPTLTTESRLKQAIDDGAVLAIGHHPHVVQGFEIYDGRLIAWSMGNFMFDQFHYATKRSYLLYVWMDGEEFHRAEVMPLRIKGYLPMPATDSFRQSILRRVNELSGRRGLALRASGGNAVILPDAVNVEPRPATPLGAAREPAGIHSLNGRGWHNPVASIQTDPIGNTRVRLGKDLLPMGHLESHDLFGVPDRSWIEDGSQAVVRLEDAPSGSRAMRLRVPAGTKEGRVGMRTFEYTFEPGTPTTFVATARTSGPATVTAYQQWRKRDQNRMDALQNGKLRIIGQRELEPGGWKELRFDFDSPRVTAISYRVVLEITPQDASRDHESWFDDLALIEWLSTPLPAGPVPPRVPGKLASHAEVMPAGSP